MRSFLAGEIVRSEPFSLKLGSEQNVVATTLDALRQIDVVIGRGLTNSALVFLTLAENGIRMIPMQEAPRAELLDGCDELRAQLLKTSPEVSRQ
jgi:hypothetical protein